MNKLNVNYIDLSTSSLSHVDISESLQGIINNQSNSISSITSSINTIDNTITSIQSLNEVQNQSLTTLQSDLATKQNIINSYNLLHYEYVYVDANNNLDETLETMNTQIINQ